MAMSPPASKTIIKMKRQHGTSFVPCLHAEVDRLPEKYRLPVILCYLEGKTNEEVADLLHWPVGTVKGRLSRARDLLALASAAARAGPLGGFLLTALSPGQSIRRDGAG